MDSTTYTIAYGAADEPEVATCDGLLTLRGKCCPRLVGRFVSELGRHWRHDEKPAIVSTATTSDGRWACIAQIDAKEADEDHLGRAADAGCRVLGMATTEPSSGYFSAVYDPDVQALVWRSLMNGAAVPELVAAVLTA